MLRITKFTPTAADIGSEVIYIPDCDKGILTDVEGLFAQFKVYGCKLTSTTDIRNLRLSFRSMNEKKLDRVKTRRPNKDSVGGN